MKLKNIFITATLLLSLNHSVHANTNAKSLVTTLSSSWADITYTVPEDQKTERLKALYNLANISLRHHQDNPDLLSWAGIITASFAGSKGGLGALKLAKKARTHLEAAVSIDPEALNGGARTSLGALYYQVPPWPVGFGNSNRAEELLSKSYKAHPENIDVLFFYADFLLDQKRYPEALKVFSEAAALPTRQHRTVADSGRHEQIQSKLELLHNLTS